MSKGAEMQVPLQQGAVYMVDGLPYRMCSCDNLSAVCPRGRTRQIQTAGYNHCLVPAPGVVLVMEGAKSEPAAADSGRPYSYEFIKGRDGEGGHFRIRDFADNAIGFCYSEFNAQHIVHALNGTAAAPEAGQPT